MGIFLPLCPFFLESFSSVISRNFSISIHFFVFVAFPSMVNLPQDLLTVGSNVCDFWIWKTILISVLLYGYVITALLTGHGDFKKPHVRLCLCTLDICGHSVYYEFPKGFFSYKSVNKSRKKLKSCFKKIFLCTKSLKIFTISSLIDLKGFES